MRLPATDPEAGDVSLASYFMKSFRDLDGAEKHLTTTEQEKFALLKAHYAKMNRRYKQRQDELWEERWRMAQWLMSLVLGGGGGGESDAGAATGGAEAGSGAVEESVRACAHAKDE
jgi:hypothetical protein